MVRLAPVRLAEARLGQVNLVRKSSRPGHDRLTNQFRTGQPGQVES